MKKGRLVLENGMVFEGVVNGAETAGEVVFNTGMTGYQEILTDPSYCGQIITMTFPLIGNYGINEDDFESTKSYAKGFVAAEICEKPSNFRCSATVSEYLEKQGVTVLAGIDTRKLVRILRESGTMKGAIVAEDGCGRAKGMIGDFGIVNPVEEVTTREKKGYRSREGLFKVALMDYGVKRNIVNSLLKRGVDVDVFPSMTKAGTILESGYDGVMLSNGPGDPKDCAFEIGEIARMAGKLPIFAICLGHQLAALAMGADTCKLKYGHRGGNHPVKDLAADRTYITSQNHGYAVTADSLKDIDAHMTHVNMNDSTVEGISYGSIPLYSVQFHPEASPGPLDTAYLFDDFIGMMKTHKEKGGLRCLRKTI
jgi:carbamoyl-phosphate synthase small subunit